MPANRQGGLVRIANDIQQRGQVGNVPASGLGAAVAGIGDELNRTAAKVGQLADHAAAVEGAEAGRLAGLDPEFRPTRSLTIRGEAYDKAGLAVMETRLKTGMEGDLAAAYDALSADPQKLEAAINEKGLGWVGEAPAEIRPALQLALNSAKTAYMRDALREQVRRVHDESQAALQTEIGDGLKTLHQRAFALGLDGEADAIIGDHLAILDKALARTDVTGKRLIAPEAAAKVRQDAIETATTARVLGAFDRLPGVAAKEKFLADFEADFAASQGLAKTFDLGGFQQVSNLLRADLTRAKTETAVAGRALGEEVKSIVDVLQKGGTVPAAQVAGLDAQLSALGGSRPELAADVEAAKGLFRYSQGVRMLAPADLDRVLAAQRERIGKGGSSPYAVAELGLGEGLAREMRSQLKQDPLGWAARVGVLPVAGLDFSSPERATATLKVRLAQAETVGAHYGQAPHYLRPDEKRELATAMARGGSEAMGIATAIAAATGERAVKVMGELSDAAPVVAGLGALVAETGATPAARDAFDALAARQERTKGGKSLPPVPMPKASDVQISAKSVAGNALAADPRNEAAAINAANLVYEIRAARAHKDSFDAELWEQGLREVLGERQVGGVAYGGIARQGGGWFADSHDIVLPPQVRQDTWQETIAALSPAVLEQAGLGQPVSASGKAIGFDRLKAGILVQVGAGRYLVALGDPGTPGEEQYARDGRAPGEPLVLDFARLTPVLQRRRPDLFLGGR